MSALFLYTELADYFLKSCEALAVHMPVHIVRWPVNPEAPFQFSFPANVTVYEKNDHPGEKLEQLVTRIQPRIIFCSGWVDKSYLRIVGRWAGKVPTVMVLDTKWSGGARQQVARLISRLYLRPRFSHAWVTGQQQKKYARRLGFPVHRIRTGFYTCDLDRFNSYYNEYIVEKQLSFPKRFVFAGRYYEFKGVHHLWEAFSRIDEKHRKGWELWCAGTGTLAPVKKTGIRHFGFVQPRELGTLMSGGGVFVLPSTFEPWGVVVHEFAAAGFPLLLSNQVGAAESFLEEGKNGYSFAAGNVAELTNALKKVMALDDKELLLMAEKSHALAQENNPAKWAHTALEFLDGWRGK